MSSLPALSVLEIPSLERSSSDSPPSTSMSSLDNPSPGFVSTGGGAYQQPYTYLPTPAASTPAYGYSSPFPSAGMNYSPDLSCAGYNYDPYGYAFMTAQQQRYAANSALSFQPRPTGCVSPLDLFGSASVIERIQPTGFGGLAGLNTGLGGLGLSQTFDAQREAEESMSAPQTDLPSPASSVDSCMAVDVKPVSKELAKKKRKLQPQPVPVVPAVEIKHEAVIEEDEEEVEGEGDEEDEGEDGCGATKKGEKADKEGKEPGAEGKKRSRTAQACERCRIRKARCFGGNPCNRCIKRKFVCEFTPTRARLMAASKPEPKPKARRHSMHTVPSASARITIPAHPLALTQVHSHSQTQSLAQQHRHQHQQLHPHSHSLSQSMHLSGGFNMNMPLQSALSTPALPGMHPHALNSVPAFPLVPALNSAGLSRNLGLGLGLQLSPTSMEDDGEAESDLDMPGMSGSFISSTGSGSGSTDSAGWSSLLTGTASEMYTPLIEDEVFPFSSLGNAQHQMDWGFDETPFSGFSSTPISSLPLSGGLNSFGVTPSSHIEDDAASRRMFVAGGTDWYMSTPSF